MTQAVMSSRWGWRRQAGWFVGVAALVLGGGALNNMFAQRDLSSVEVKVEKVAGPVHVLFGAGGNIGVSAGEDGLLMVDDQFAELEDKIRAAMKGLAKGELGFVLNTHYHGDHTGGNAQFGVDAPIVAHTNVRKRLGDREHPPLGSTEVMPKVGLPVITFDDSLSIHFNGEEIKVVHFPTSHTDGDSIIFFTGSNVVHMGDTMFASGFPFVDINGGGTVPGLIRTVTAVLGEVADDVKIIPGHGALSTKSDLRDYLEMLKQTSRVVEKKMQAGKSLDEIKAEGLPAKFEDWGKGFISTERWIETIHTSLELAGA